MPNYEGHSLTSESSVEVPYDIQNITDMLFIQGDGAECQHQFFM